MSSAPAHVQGRGPGGNFGPGALRASVSTEAPTQPCGGRRGPGAGADRRRGGNRRGRRAAPSLPAAPDAGPLPFPHAVEGQGGELPGPQRRVRVRGAASDETKGLLWRTGSRNGRAVNRAPCSCGSVAAAAGCPRCSTGSSLRRLRSIFAKSEASPCNNRHLQISFL